ncbi:MAG: 16S rRNA (cytidine(1402)-2'-O)-methyltransferase [Planktomarina sp.]|jgi:16S rRNA (cytidine1402-2'-O)-methyltransferase|nr:16S rRNA (cytidine(1402)-2'-O)-methyltransferase [Planktomarina sp.]MDT2072683.1 16S rRNA (cytidine(1402)-2'-O)-methyltransferase [Planktomarina sp.]MDT2077245.1 16S rRNA (cytidine(1402)-2'-O)-methyltransferase [Planktomarina sp.]HAJ84774.1 16S rRNA (cytidine(1402)-2'-O)-methyltransferase [Paracoccaceae bacterium]|tara:strand:+ start:10469 stop:11338 length:870 start_codon:yes stop_codon:yes gene_type:complete
MNHKLVKLEAGLYLVATPLGSARDITLRALDILASADVLAAEDTRTARKLLDIHGVPLEGRRIIAYHDHSNASDRQRVLNNINEGKSVAYISEAGTPLIADPGYQLVRDARQANMPVLSAPGPTACIAALTIAGLPTDQFHFAGFLPPQQTARQKSLVELMPLRATLVLYESAKRLNALLMDIEIVGGSERHVAVCRELTKRFEDVQIGPVNTLRAFYEAKPAKGEIVVLIGTGEDNKVDEIDLEAALVQAMLSFRVKDAADTVAGAYGLPRREIYQMALRLQGVKQLE